MKINWKELSWPLCCLLMLWLWTSLICWVLKQSSTTVFYNTRYRILIVVKNNNNCYTLRHLFFKIVCVVLTFPYIFLPFHIIFYVFYTFSTARHHNMPFSRFDWLVGCLTMIYLRGKNHKYNHVNKIPFSRLKPIHTQNIPWYY